MIPVQLKINIISYVSFLSFRGLFIPLQPTLPPGLAASVAPSCCQCSQNRVPKPRAPAGPCNGKQMAGPLTAAGCSRQSRRGNFSFAVIHHRGREEKRGRKDRATPDTGRLASFKRLHMAHSWLVLIHTCKNTCIHMKSGPYSLTHTHCQASEYILAHVPVFCLSLVVLFFSAAG